VKIKNEMETAVRAEFVRQTGEGESGTVNIFLRAMKSLFQEGKVTDLHCSCPWCRHDVLALALTGLPPCYCRSHHYGMNLRKIETRSVGDAMSKAIRRVGGRPRHSPRDQVPAEEGVHLVDYRLREGTRIVGPLLGKLPGICDCQSCRTDILAHSLNRFSPRYGVLASGKSRLQPHDLEFIRHEMNMVMVDSARKIALNPRHEGTDGA